MCQANTTNNNTNVLWSEELCCPWLKVHLATPALYSVLQGQWLWRECGKYNTFCSMQYTLTAAGKRDFCAVGSDHNSYQGTYMSELTNSCLKCLCNNPLQWISVLSNVVLICWIFLISCIWDKVNSCFSFIFSVAFVTLSTTVSWAILYFSSERWPNLLWPGLLVGANYSYRGRDYMVSFVKRLSPHHFHGMTFS